MASETNLNEKEMSEGQSAENRYKIISLMNSDFLIY